MKREKCEGCNTLNGGDGCPWYHEDLDCPCANCLIKMMCYLTCPSFKKYSDKINGRMSCSR